ncbi:MAG: quinoprotein dehydrogenase-associated putative ABC transporter substrate-binding protein [Alphaproteobacteria bacterium]|nr:quinoprotein dehydrogenase-associated putative ABC transporter substrate-binding protein [Alphaproteobacteria bacterium]
MLLRRLASLLAVLPSLPLALAHAEAPLPAARLPGPDHPLRVCADPNNLPFSNAAEAGFENEVARLVAEEMEAPLVYEWWAQRRGFIRNTLKAGTCDVVIGVPAGYELVETTRPYYRSGYVWVYPRARGLDLRDITDPRLRELKIGVHLIGDDGSNTPPAHALGQQGIVDGVHGYLIYGDYRSADPAAEPVRAVARGEVDVAAVWGPLGGYFARSAAIPLAVMPISETGEFAPLRFRFAIAMGVRHGDEELRAALDGILARREGDITAILARYGVPLMPARERNVP